MISNLIKIDRIFEILYNEISHNYNQKIHKHILGIIDKYLTDYAQFHRLTIHDILDAHQLFVGRYTQDLKSFQKTGLFPLQNPDWQPFKIDRTTYDVSLIMSTLVTEHRFRIMLNIYETPVPSGQALVVGLGSGIELAFIRKKFKEIDGFDIKLSDFCKHKFSDLNLKEEPFQNKNGKEYDAIYAVEILEHLENPYDLLRRLSLFLKKNGILIATTIKNVPQFDHLYNFQSEDEFEMEVKGFGLKIVKKLVLKHDYFLQGIDANNVFYILKKSKD